MLEFRIYPDFSMIPPPYYSKTFSTQQLFCCVNEANSASDSWNKIFYNFISYLPVKTNRRNNGKWNNQIIFRPGRRRYSKSGVSLLKGNFIAIIIRENNFRKKSTLFADIVINLNLDDFWLSFMRKHYTGVSKRPLQDRRKKIGTKKLNKFVTQLA